MKTFREIWEKSLPTIVKYAPENCPDLEIIPIMKETIQEYLYAKTEARNPMCASIHPLIDWDDTIDLEDIYITELVYKDVLTKITGKKYTDENYNLIHKDFEDQYCTLTLSACLLEFPDSWSTAEKVKHILSIIRGQGTVLLISGKFISWASEGRVARVKYVPKWKSNQKVYENQYILDDAIHYQEKELQVILEKQINDLSQLPLETCNPETENIYSSKAVMDTFTKIMNKLDKLEILVKDKICSEGCTYDECICATCPHEDPNCFKPVFKEDCVSDEISNDDEIQIESDDYNSDNITINKEQEDAYFRTLEEVENKTHSLEFSHFKKMLSKCFYKCYNTVSLKTFIEFDKKFSNKLTGIFTRYQAIQQVDCCGDTLNTQQVPQVWIPNLMKLLIALKVKYKDMRKQHTQNEWVYFIGDNVFSGTTIEEVILQMLNKDYIDDTMIQSYLQIY